MVMGSRGFYGVGLSLRRVRPAVSTLEGDLTGGSRGAE